ncbi:hypothetical protein FGU65_15445, partial [Methanoculleus sp. FWC-SCC1]
MSWEKKRVWIIVKAYPEYSRKYRDWVACTAGITEDGDWIRLYPVPTRHYIGETKIKKFDLVEIVCQKATTEKLARKESYKVKEGSEIKIVSRSLSGNPTSKIWKERNKLILDKIDPSLDNLNHKYRKDKTSLGLIKPKQILDFYSRKKLEIYAGPQQYQQNIDGSKTPVIQKIPHTLAYRFKCSDDCPTCMNGQHDIQCEDWELIEAYRKWGHTYGDIQTLWEKLYEKFHTYEDFEKPPSSQKYFIVPDRPDLHEHVYQLHNSARICLSCRPG